LRRPKHDSVEEPGATLRSKKAEILHYAGYFALYIGHVVRYVMLGDFYNAARSAALAEGSLELATRFETPEDWDGFSEGEEDARRAG
jgi:hypothetical protein